jgi:hypothetical protein
MNEGEVSNERGGSIYGESKRGEQMRGYQPRGQYRQRAMKDMVNPQPSQSRG